MAFSALWRQASSPIPHKLQGLMTCHILKCAAKRWWRFVKSILSRNFIFLLFTGAHVLCVWHGLGRIMMGPNINEMGRPRCQGWIHAPHVLAFFVRYFLFDVLLSSVGIFFPHLETLMLLILSQKWFFGMLLFVVFLTVIIFYFGPLVMHKPTLTMKIRCPNNPNKYLIIRNLSIIKILFKIGKICYFHQILHL